MAKTIVISNASYSSVALDVVSFDGGGSVPCTGITLNKNTCSFDSVGDTDTLIATLVPANTTDLLSWTSSDENVATVSNGVITTVGVGTATITAVCGSYSASCVVTSRAFMNSNVYQEIGSYLDGNALSEDGNGIAAFTSATRAGELLSNTGTLHIYNESDAFPYMLPNNTAKVKLTVTSGNVTNVYRVCWFSSTISPEGYSGISALIAKTSSPTLSGGVCEIDVPAVSGYTIDSVAIGVRVGSGATLTTEDLNGVTVEFLPTSQS